MAIAIMGGLSLATFLTLINLPALYILLFRVRPPRLNAVLMNANSVEHELPSKKQSDRAETVFA